MNFWKTWNLFLPPIRAIFFCRTSDVAVTMARIARRGRKEELGLKHSVDELPTDDAVGIVGGGVSVDYQRALLAKHHEFFGGAHVNAQTVDYSHVPCVQVDMDLPYHNDGRALRQLAALMATAILNVASSYSWDHTGGRRTRGTA
jgi:hypothetical protein